MMKPALALLLVASFQVQADPISQYAQCINVDNDIARLQCFDQVSAKVFKTQANSESAQAAAKVQPQVTTAAAKAVTATAAATTATVAAAPTVKAETESEGTFGLPRGDDETESISSRMVGEFKGWVKGTVIILENGQEWRVTGASRGYARMVDPKVTISEGIFGSYDMRVENFKLPSKVKRIK